MPFTYSLEPGVRPHGQSAAGLDVIKPASKPRMTTVPWRCGTYGFTNPYSANMFSYLFRYQPKNSTFSYTTAPKTVQAFEDEMFKTAGQLFWDMVELDWNALVQGDPRSFVDLKGMIEKMCGRIVGVWVMGEQIRAGMPTNHYYPDDSGRAQYVEYAIRYWARHPMQGPAYRYGSRD